MQEIETKNYYQTLLAVYGSLLTPTQKGMVEEYFSLDFSLSEIGENHAISKSGAYDAIKRSMNKLDDYENKLNIVKNNRQILKLVEELETTDNGEVIKRIKELFDYGI